VAIEEGQKLGNYRVVRRLGAGGMGEVYLAEHPLIGKRVALKVIHRDFAGANAESVARFANEARAVSQVGGDHVVQIHDFGETPDGDCFFVMDYLAGRTLAEELAGGRPLSVQRALYVGAQLAQALSAVHAQGILHRDLKPDNVMLVERGGDPDFVVLLDFGLAKFLGDSRGPQLTAQGMLIGTPQYMSPEACEGKGRVDHRSDQYALGILLFQMSTGVLPFDGAAMGDVLVQQVSRHPPPPRSFNAEVPPSVEQIILRCLAKDPELRFPDMEALRVALLDPERYLASSPPVLPTSQRRPAELPRASAAQQLETAPLRPGPSARAPTGSDGATKMMFTQRPGTEPPLARGVARAPSRAEPVVPANRTMAIATPPGHYRRSHRRRWPLAVIAVLGLGTVVAVAARESAPRSAHDTPSQGADAGVSTVHLTVVSRPAGARVMSQGRILGVTPLALEVPRADEIRTLRLTHPDAVPREKRYDASRDATIDVELAARPASSPVARTAGSRDEKEGRAVRRPERAAMADAGPAPAPDAALPAPRDRVLRPSF